MSSSIKMKGSLLHYLGSLAWFYLSVTATEAQALTAEELVNGKLAELERFVTAVETNSQNCSALQSCSESSCSRLSCYQYGTVGDPHYQCVKVKNNTGFCGPTCTWRNFDYSRSFVRLVDPISHTAETVCTQRTLDDEFRSSTMNDSTQFFRVFFGATDGTTRIYPGADENCTADISTYDPRVRLWYKRSTNVKKVVSILIDSGLNMIVHEPIMDSSDKYLDKAIKTARIFLGTLTNDTDYVNITCFDGDGTFKSPNVTSITKYNNETDYELFNDFLANISRNSVKSSKAVDVSSAINTSIIQLNSASYPKETHLKVVIVLTTNDAFGTLSNLDIPANSGVNAFFVYSFNSENLVAECNSTVQAFSEKIPTTRQDNPLYALESYYSFLAKVHRNSSESAVQYSPKHGDYSEVDSNSLTLSKAAFDLNGELVGVVGIDIFDNKFTEQFRPSRITFQDVAEATGRILLNYSVSEGNMITSVSFNPYKLTEHCSPKIDISTNAQRFLCGHTNTVDTKVGCCDNCTAPGHGTGTELPKILGGVGGGIVGLLVIAAIGLFTWHCVARRMEDERALAENPQFTFPGRE